MSELENFKQFIMKEINKLNAKIQTLSNKVREIQVLNINNGDDIKILDTKVYELFNAISKHNLNEDRSPNYKIQTRSQTNLNSSNKNSNKNVQLDDTNEKINSKNIFSVLNTNANKLDSIEQNNKSKNKKENKNNNFTFSKGNIDNNSDDVNNISDNENNNSFENDISEHINNININNAINDKNNIDSNSIFTLNENNKHNIDNNQTNIDNNSRRSQLSTSINYSVFSFNPQANAPNNEKINGSNKKSNEITNDLLTQSGILKSFSETNLIFSNFPNFNKFDPNSIKTQVIYKASTNGDLVKNFHKFCDGEPNILVAIESDGGCRFGGFTKIGFNSNSNEQKDDNAFLFSLDKMKIYKDKRKNKYIICNAEHGPCFGKKGGEYIHISDEFFKNWSFVEKIGSGKQNYELNNGVREFKIKELEIIKILI